jgi:hypothetical protein
VMTGAVLPAPPSMPGGWAITPASRPAAWSVPRACAERGPASPTAPRPGTPNPGRGPAGCLLDGLPPRPLRGQGVSARQQPPARHTVDRSRAEAARRDPVARGGRGAKPDQQAGGEDRGGPPLGPPPPPAPADPSPPGRRTRPPTGPPPQPTHQHQP